MQLSLSFSSWSFRTSREENFFSSLSLPAKSFTYTENKFNVGMMNATDYNIAKTNLFKAVSAYYQAKYQYLFEVKILDFYKGKAINL